VEASKATKRTPPMVKNRLWSALYCAVVSFSKPVLASMTAPVAALYRVNASVEVIVGRECHMESRAWRVLD
jgi:hypothetical protein